MQRSPDAGRTYGRTSPASGDVIYDATVHTTHSYCGEPYISHYRVSAEISVIYKIKGIADSSFGQVNSALPWSNRFVLPMSFSLSGIGFGQGIDTEIYCSYPRDVTNTRH